MENWDVIILGAGAAGLMCAIEAGKRQRSVLVLDHANKPGKKILMSGGGRCNFTNLNIIPENYISHNPHFCKSALSRYTAQDFIRLVKKHQIKFHEKTLGQLFCDNKSQEILNMLLQECRDSQVDIRLNTTVNKIEHPAEQNFKIQCNSDIQSKIQCRSLVVATGGLSVPTLGASPFGYKIAEQFNIKVWPTRAGLVPFTLHSLDKEKYTLLSGVSVKCTVRVAQRIFSENLLFTHRGLSGPAILQISSYWQPGEAVIINLLPEIDLLLSLKKAQQGNPKKQLHTLMGEYLPKRVVESFLDPTLANKTLQTLSLKDLEATAKHFCAWSLKPNATEGYRTAEVTLGGVDCNALSSKTMESKEVPGLYFIGEVVDITGWLGGFNFQWAWSTGWAAGQVV
ncbi:MAG TPA: NAD(P)/FAD-dependent oxidoreductase [Gammaproteobacteria bacterium]|nr:NAD(P)/FAD-dependent oxidoreductase [Gammaproteobacteria bacterium]